MLSSGFAPQFSEQRIDAEQMAIVTRASTGCCDNTSRIRRWGSTGTHCVATTIRSEPALLLDRSFSAVSRWHSP